MEATLLRKILIPIYMYEERLEKEERYECSADKCKKNWKAKAGKEYGHLSPDSKQRYIQRQDI